VVDRADPGRGVAPDATDRSWAQQPRGRPRGSGLGHGPVLRAARLGLGLRSGARPSSRARGTAACGRGSWP